MILNEKSTIQSCRQTMIITLYIKYARYHILENNLIRREQQGCQGNWKLRMTAQKGELQMSQVMDPPLPP